MKFKGFYLEFKVKYGLIASLKITKVYIKLKSKWGFI